MGVISEVATTVAENAVPRKKLRWKILAKKPVNVASEISQAPVGDSLKEQPLIAGKSKTLVERKLESSHGTKHVIGCSRNSSEPQNRMTAVTGDTKSESIAVSKRRSEEALEGHKRKRTKMDRLATLNCQTILEKLKDNQWSHLFSTPVDPDAWDGIDDYFDIIKNPMDLGTIQKKLQKKTYIHVEEFEADVRLTFSNAMLYNPPDNWVHNCAKELDMIFTSLWKHYKIRMDGEQKDMKQGVGIKQRGPESNHDKITGVKGKCYVSRSSQNCQLPRKVMPQKQRDSEALKKLSVEGQRLVDIKVVKPQDGKPKDPLSLNGCDCAPFPTGSLGATTKALDLEIMDAEVSPSKALRVARLKSRFADTILKAQHHTLLEPGGETDAANWQQEKLTLERRQQEEKARIEAQIRAVESAARLKAESELKQQRQAAREASRLAVEKMKRSVDLEDNLHVLRDLEAMIGSSLVVVCHDRRSHSTVWSQIESKKLRSPLERLGLYIKEEYMVGDDDDDYDVEEGEVLL